jgi:hypothetical protein
MGNPLPVVGPPCPRCQFTKTERLDFVALKPQVFQCGECGYFWFVKAHPRKLTNHVFSLVHRWHSRLSLAIVQKVTRTSSP